MLFEVENYVLLNKLITLITNFWLYVNAINSDSLEWRQTIMVWYCRH